MPETAALRRMTLPEFLAWNPGGDARYELVDGQPIMMAPPKVPHVDIADNVTGFLRPRLRPPCRTSQGVGVLVDLATDTYLEADVAVSCEPRRVGQQHLEAPRLVVEILSPSTRAHDLGVKLDLYRALTSVDEILLVSSTDRRVTHWRREGDHWLVQDVIGRGAVALGLVGEPLDLDTIYDGVTLEAGNLVRDP
jgi:Uma2 family endonuclease